MMDMPPKTRPKFEVGELVSYNGKGDDCMISGVPPAANKLFQVKEVSWGMRDTGEAIWLVVLDGYFCFDKNMNPSGVIEEWLDPFMP